MGQTSSKRRQRASGKSKSGNSETGSQAKREDVNGSIEICQDKDISIATGGRHSTPTSPTSVTSVSPPKTPEKKEKRKRFRVGFSLKRTPSGRWSRKKKTPTQNGTRPVSCPDPLKGEQILNPSRPQSLFLEELQIEEDDNKIETVDLSDNEDGKAVSTDGNKTAPKVVEKTKWRRGSNKKSSGKKKKKEKEPSKKEKKKKQKNAEKLTNAANVSEVDSQVCMKTATATEKRPTPMTESDNVAKAAIIDLQQSEIDFDKIASTIVAQTVKIAQERLRAESCNGSPSAPLIEDKAKLVDTEINTLQQVCVVSEGEEAEINTLQQVCVVSEGERAVSEDVPLGVVEELSSTELETADSAVRIAQDIISEIMDKSVQVVNQHPVDVDSKSELQNAVKVEKTVSDGAEMLVQDSSEEVETEVEKCEQSRENLFHQYEIEDSVKIKSYIIQENLSTDDDTSYKNTDKKADRNIEEYVSEMIAKKTVENVIAAALKTVHEEDFKNFNKHNKIDEHCIDISLQSKNSTDEYTNQQKKDDKEIFEIKEEKEVLEIVSDVNCKQLEGKLHEKNEKEKPKSDIKIKVQKKLSHWFHKKDKQPKSVSKVETPTTSTKESALSGDASGCSRRCKDFSQNEMLESNACQMKSRNPSSPSSSVNNSLSLDVSVEPLVVTTSTPSESSPDSNAVISPSSSISPISITSDSSELGGEPAAGDKKTGSGILKKIFLGQRLRTAILRKKSSDESEDVHGTDTFLLTPPKPSDSSVLTPPPRKSHNKKSEQQSSSGAHEVHSLPASKDTTPQSPYEITDSVLIYNTEFENSVTVDDSGFADLTSPESNKSDIYLEETAAVLGSAQDISEETAAALDSAQDISEETAAALDKSAQDISEETAAALDKSTQDISEETAAALDSAQDISEETAAVLDSAQDISEETAAVIDYGHKNTVDRAAVLNSAQENSEITTGLASAYWNSQETAAVPYSGHENSDDRAAVLDPGHENSEITTVLDSAFWNSQETAAVLDPGYDNSEITTVLESAYWNSQETAAVLYSGHENSDDRAAVLDPGHENSEITTVLESAHWNSQETAAVLDSGNRTSEETLAGFDSSNAARATLFTNRPNDSNASSHNDRVNPCDYDDDTRPLPIDYPVPVACSNSVDYFPPLESTKLISTAMIILRSPSNNGQVVTANKLSTVKVNSDFRTQPVMESNLPASDLSNDQYNSSISTPAALSFESSELKESLFPLPTFERHTIFNDKYNEEQPKIKAQKTTVHDVLASVEPNCVQPNAMNDYLEKHVQDFDFIESETLIQKDESCVRTIAEYKIGMPSQYENLIHKRLLTEYPVGEVTGRDASTRLEDTKDYITEFHYNRAEAQELGESVVSNSSYFRTSSSSSSDDSTLSKKQLPQQKQHEHPLTTEYEHKLQGSLLSVEDYDVDTKSACITFINHKYDSSISENLRFPEAASDAVDCVKDTNNSDIPDGSDATKDKTRVSGNGWSNNLQDSDVSSAVSKTSGAFKKLHNGEINEGTLN